MGEGSDQEREKNAPRFSELGPPLFHGVRSPQSPFPSAPLTRTAECPIPQRARNSGWRPSIPERCPLCPRCGLGQAALIVHPKLFTDGEEEPSLPPRSQL